jgi:hypothetical protein
MTPDSMSFGARLHDSPLPQADAGPVPTSGWYATSVPADSPHQVCSTALSSSLYMPNALQGVYPSYDNFNQSYAPPSAGPYSPHPHGVPDVSVNAPIKGEQPAGTFSPVSNSSRASEAPRSDYVHHSQAASPEAVSATHLTLEMTPNRPRSSPEEYHWPMNPLGIQNSNMSQSFYPSPSFPQGRQGSPCMSEPAMELSAPQARRFYAPIAPHPSGARTSAPKRSREEDEEQLEQGKRRKRSDSNTSATMELGEEDRLLIQLKDEESMPWKDIAARFQSDLGKTYQIPALQMRLKRLRERMRVWTDVDVKALRMAHEYWVQSKFDIIAQKVSFTGTYSDGRQLTQVDARVWCC